MKLRLSILFVLLLGAAGLFAQKGIVKVDPFGLLIGQINVGYEHVLNEKSGIEVGLSYFRYNVTFGSAPEEAFSGIGGYAMYRIYFAKALDAPRGLYAAPRIGFGSTGSSSSDQKNTRIAIGGLFGHQWVWPKDGDAGFTLDLALGIAYRTNNNEGISFNEGIGPAIRVAIGYAF